MAAELNTAPVISADWPWKIEGWYALKGDRGFYIPTDPLLGHGDAVAQNFIDHAADTLPKLRVRRQRDSAAI